MDTNYQNDILNGETDYGGYLHVEGEDLVGRVYKNMSLFMTSGTRFEANPEEDFYAFEQEEAEYDEEEVVGLAPLPVEHSRTKINLNDPPAFGLVENMLMSLTEDGGVKKLVLRKGSGKTLPPNCKVWFHYVSFVNNEQAFIDSTILRKTTQSCRLGAGSDVIRGLKIGLQSMEFREISQFFLTPKYAYGKYGCPPRIPADCTLIINVMILNMITEDQLKCLEYMSAEERASSPFPELLKVAQRKKLAGNTRYAGNDFYYAVKEYRRGINFLEEFSNVTKDEIQERDHLLSILYTNLAQAYLKLNKGPQACNACKNALRSSGPELHQKIFFRFAKAKFMLGSPLEALDLVRKSLRTPNPKKEIQEYEKMIIGHIKRKTEEDQIVEKILCKKMMGMGGPGPSTS